MSKKPSPASDAAPEDTAAAAALPEIDPHAGTGGAYRLIDGRRELIERTAPRDESAQPKS